MSMLAPGSTPRKGFKMSRPVIRPVHLFLSGLIILALFGSLSIAVQRGILFTQWDEACKNRLHEAAHARPGMTAVFTTITGLSNERAIWAEMIAVLLLLMLQRHWPSIAIWLMAFAGTGIVKLVKVVIDRPRPVFEDPLVREMSRSFPSGHAAGAMLIFGTLLVLLTAQARERRWLFSAIIIPLIAAIGFSRLWLGAHWLSDVLGGWLFGLGWILVVVGAIRFLRRASGDAATSK